VAPSTYFQGAKTQDPRHPGIYAPPMLTGRPLLGAVKRAGAIRRRFYRVQRLSGRRLRRSLSPSSV